MRVALNWFEITLPSMELAVPVHTVLTAEHSAEQPHYCSHFAHRVVQRRGDTSVRLLHLTDVPPDCTKVESIKASEDPDFVKIAVEEGFARLLAGRGFSVYKRHVGGTAYRATEESLWPEIYSFWRGLSFRAFYLKESTRVRWGIILNYATSQRFMLTLADVKLQSFALGKRVLRVDNSSEVDEEEQGRSGILLSVKDGIATVDFGIGNPIESQCSDWTIPCRRDLLYEYVNLLKGQKAGAELTRKLQQAVFCLTDNGRMNTALARSQVEAIQQLLHRHNLGKINLPLPVQPSASLSNRPLTIAE